MELTFLGTGAGVPSKERNVTAIALSLLQENNSVWLFDCGEATQHQILYTSIKPRKINKIFITHLHGDHIFGLPGFLSSRSFQGGEDPLYLYGPPGTQLFVETSLKVSKSHLAYPLYIEEIGEGKVLEDDQFIVHAVKLDHGIDSYGFRVEEKDKPGKLLVDKLKNIGILPGPIYKQIKENNTVTTADGRVIQSKNFIGPSKKGRTLCIFGDTRYQESHANFAKNADILVHEATFDRESEHLAYEYFHSTTVQAAKLAKRGNVNTLILTHISSRYQEKATNTLLTEAREIFPETYLADDFYQKTIEKQD